MNPTEHETYTLAMDDGDDRPIVRRVSRHPSAADTFDTLDSVPPPCLLEMEDACYHLGSAVTLPVIPTERGDDDSEDFTISDGAMMAAIERGHPRLHRALTDGLAGDGSDDDGPWDRRTMCALAVTYAFLETNPGYRLIIAGHTDTSGSDAANFALSEQRALNVKHLLLGERGDWVNVCRARSTVADYQRILQHYGDEFAWGCDPGPVDDIDGALTKAAVRQFQRVYNQTFSRSIDVDGIVGKQTWGAFFDCYMAELAALVGVRVEELDGCRDHVRWVDDGFPVIACGERIPIDSPGRDHYQSEQNRRVDLLFFPATRLPDLAAHRPGGAFRRDRAGIETSGVYRPGYGPLVDIEPLSWEGEPPPCEDDGGFELLDIDDEDLEDRIDDPESDGDTVELDSAPIATNGAPDWQFVEVLDDLGTWNFDPDLERRR